MRSKSVLGAALFASATVLPLMEAEGLNKLAGRLEVDEKGIVAVHGAERPGELRLAVCRSSTGSARTVLGYNPFSHRIEFQGDRGLVDLLESGTVACVYDTPSGPVGAAVGYTAARAWQVLGDTATALAKTLDGVRIGRIAPIKIFDTSGSAEPDTPAILVVEGRTTGPAVGLRAQARVMGRHVPARVKTAGKKFRVEIGLGRRDAARLLAGAYTGRGGVELVVRRLFAAYRARVVFRAPEKIAVSYRLGDSVYTVVYSLE